MSIVGDLLQAFGGYAGAKQGADATNRAAELQFRLGQDALNLAKAGTVDASGNIIGRVDPATGAPTTTLSGPFQSILNQQVSNTAGVGNLDAALLEQTSGRVANIPNQRRSREDITIEVDADNRRLQESIIGPAINSATIQDQRTRGGTSNMFSRSSNVANVTRDLGNTLNFRRGEQIESRLNTSNINTDTDALRLRPNPTQVGIPGTPSSIPGINAGFQLAALSPVDSGAGLGANAFAQFGALQNTSEREEKLRQAIERGLGNQFNRPGAARARG